MAFLTWLALVQAAATPPPALPADAYAAGLACATAVGIGRDAGASPLQLTAEFTYFVMQAARANPGTGRFAARTSELIAEVRKQPRPADAEAKARRQSCYRRWPLAEGRAAVTLPAAPLPRGLTCIGALGIMVGAAQELAKRGDRAGLDRYEPVLKRWSATLTDAYLATQGVTSNDQMAAALGQQLQTSLTLGNTRSIGEACVAAAPAA